MKQEMDELRTGVRQILAELGGVNGRLDKVESRLDGMDRRLRRVEVTTSNTRADLQEFADEARRTFVTKGEFHSRMDGFAGRLEDFKLHAAHQQERIDDLEKRRPRS